MKRTIQVTMSGYPTAFYMQEDADAALRAYLDRASARLSDDPDHDEVLRDLEQAIAEKLAQRSADASDVFRLDDINAVLEVIGAVDTGHAETVFAQPVVNSPRRLFRIRKGRWLAGICRGLAAYSSIRVAWVRTIFIAVSIFAAILAIPLLFASPVLGILVAAAPFATCIVLLFTLPVGDSRDSDVGISRGQTSA